MNFREFLLSEIVDYLLEGADYTEDKEAELKDDARTTVDAVLNLAGKEITRNGKINWMFPNYRLLSDPKKKQELVRKTYIYIKTLAADNWRMPRREIRKLAYTFVINRFQEGNYQKGDEFSRRKVQNSIDDGTYGAFGMNALAYGQDQPPGKFLKKHVGWGPTRRPAGTPEPENVPSWAPKPFQKKWRPEEDTNTQKPVYEPRLMPDAPAPQEEDGNEPMLTKLIKRKLAKWDKMMDYWSELINHSVPRENIQKIRDALEELHNFQTWAWSFIKNKDHPLYSVVWPTYSKGLKLANSLSSYYKTSTRGKFAS